MGLSDSEIFKKIRKVDIFGKSIDLTFDMNKKHKTFCGATITVIIFILLIVVIIILIRKAYFADYSDIASTLNLAPLETLQFPLNYKDLFFAYYLPARIYNESFLSVNISLLQDVFEEGPATKSSSYQSLNLTPCKNVLANASHIEELGPLFQNLNSSEWLCLDLTGNSSSTSEETVTPELILSKYMEVSFAVSNRYGMDAAAYQSYLELIKPFTIEMVFLNKLEQVSNREKPYLNFFSHETLRLS